MNMVRKLTFGGLSINTETQEVYRNGKKVKLRKKEYELLEFLARNKDRVINRLTILEYVWNYDVSVDTNTLEVHMVALRRKIDGGQTHKLLQTIHGRGYKLCDTKDSLGTQPQPQAEGQRHFHSPLSSSPVQYPG